MKRTFRSVISAVLAAAAAFGITAVLPAYNVTHSEFAIVSDAAESDFTIETNEYSGEKYISAYNGKGGDITIPKGVSYITANAFCDNDNITGVTFPKDIEVLGGAFQRCTALKKVQFNGDALIEDDAFFYCPNLETVTINGSITEYIGNMAFYGCQKLKSFTVRKSEYPCEIRVSAFEGCYSLTSVTIPDSCYNICANAFLNCYSLENVVIPKNTQFNGSYQFGYFTKGEKYIVADGKQKTTSLKITSESEKTARSTNLVNYWFDDEVYDNLYSVKTSYTPKKITLTVEKDSHAETYAKDNGIDYKYPGDDDKSASSVNSSKKNADVSFKASAGTDKIVLKWDKFGDADAYIVYKYNASSKKYEKYKSVSTNKCTVKGLSSNTSYKFKVTAVKKSGGKYTVSAKSAAVTVKTKKAA